MFRRQVPTGHPGERFGCLAGAAEVAGIDGCQGLVGQGLGEAFGLGQAQRAERDVGMPLDARGAVPGRLAMADEDDSRGLLQH